MTIKLADHVINLKGRAYLPVAPRVVAFREEHPDWSISTDILDGLVRATILDEHGRIIAVAHKGVTKFAGGDIEKAETGAVGRALSLCGYGTLMAGDLEEGDRLADAPIAKPEPAAPARNGKAKAKVAPAPAAPDSATILTMLDHVQTAWDLDEAKTAARAAWRELSSDARAEVEAAVAHAEAFLAKQEPTPA